MLIGLLVVLAVAVAATAEDARAGRGAAGLVIAALAALSLLTGAGSLDPARLARIGMTAAVRPWFLETCLALLGVGLVVALAGSRSWLAGLAGAGVAVSLLPVLRTISWPRAVVLLIPLGLCLYGLAFVAAAARRRLHLSAAVDALPPAAPSGTAPPANLAFLAAVAALLSPWAWLTFGASIVAFGSALALPLHRPQRLLVATSGLLVLAATVAMATGTGSPADPAAPSVGLLSASRSVVVAGLLLLPSAVALAAWPWHRLAPGLVLAPVALALVGRYAAEAAPLGLAWWLPAVFPLALAGVLYSLLRGHHAGILTGSSWVGLWIGTPVSVPGAALLAGAAILLAALPQGAGREWTRVASRVLWAAGGAGLLLVLWGGLTVQVVYTALLALVTTVGLMVPRDVAAMEAPA